MTLKINFNSADEYYIDGTPYHFETSDDLYACFRREDGSAALEWFGWEELHEIVGGPRWECKKRLIHVDETVGPPDPLVFIWELNEKQRKLFLYRWFFVSALDKLYVQNLIKLTPNDVAKSYYRLHAEASAEWRAFCSEFGKQYYCSKDVSLGAMPSASSILNWRRKVGKAKGRIDVLLDHRGNASGINIDQESYQFIIKHLRLYLRDDQYSANAVIELTEEALKKENQRRKAAGLGLLQTRRRTSLHEWIQNFGGYEIDLARKGKKFAARKYAGVGKTDRATRVGQAFIVDEWEVDARNLALSGPVREGLDQETIEVLKAMPKVRRWMYVVMDVATRYIVSFLLAETPSSENAVRAMRLAMQDKTELAKAAGCECSWLGFTCETLQSDTGTAFRAEATQRAVRTAFATYTYPNVGQPQLRGIIERMFRTFSDRAMPYIPGRTFRNPQVRGDYDTEGRAVLTDDQLAMIFIRYIVDVYHQTKHSGLFGETPENALKRLGGTTGLPPQLSLRTKRHAFGIRQERTITARGIRFLGIDYGGNCEQLQAIRKAKGSNKRPFYVDPENLGIISVWNETDWLEVECSIENFHNIRLVEWIEVGKILRSRYSSQAEMNMSIVFSALSELRKETDQIQTTMDVLPKMFTSDDLEKLDRELYWGLSVIDDGPTPLVNLPVANDGFGYVIGQPKHEANTPLKTDGQPSVERPIKPAEAGSFSNPQPEHNDTEDDKTKTTHASVQPAVTKPNWWSEEGKDD